MMPDAARLAETPLLWLVAWAYLLTNAARVFAYLPQIAAAWRSTDGARALSLWTWGSWAVSHVTALTYGTLVLGDTFFVVIAAINLLGCGAVTAIIAMHRWRQRGPRLRHSALPLNMGQCSERLG